MGQGLWLTIIFQLLLNLQKALRYFIVVKIVEFVQCVQGHMICLFKSSYIKGNQMNKWWCKYLCSGNYWDRLNEVLQGIEEGKSGLFRSVKSMIIHLENEQKRIEMGKINGILNLGQTIGSQKRDISKTSINSNKIPRLFKLIRFKRGTVNLDIGGGKFDNVTKDLARRGVDNLIYDPFNRSLVWNDHIIKKLGNKKPDTVTCSNVLNVIDSVAKIKTIVEQCSLIMKRNGTTWFTVYNRFTPTHYRGMYTAYKGGYTSKGFQRGAPIKWYLPIIRKYFNEVSLEKNMIVAKCPKGK